MKPVIYQLLVRLAGNRNHHPKPFGSIEENGCGKFNDLNDHFLQEIRRFGATHIWLTGVLEHASCTAYPAQNIPSNHPLVVKGRAGSPYAIRDYYDVSPDLAQYPEKRMQEFEDLVARCKAAGLRVIIDFVPNHVARQYHSDNQPDGVQNLGENDLKDRAFYPGNNFYYLPGQALQLPEELKQLPYIKEEMLQPYEEFPAKATGNDQFTATPTTTDWYETVKLNYGTDLQGGGAKHFEPIPDTWEKMLHILLFWSAKGVDGFRCDMAEMVPVEFWHWAIRKVKEKFPAMVFIAEIYNPRAYSDFIKTGGFDFLYDKAGLYDSLREVMSGKSPASMLSNVWQQLQGLDEYMLRFLENHDEQRIASPHFAGNALSGIPAMVVAATMHRGPLMVYFGQELGEPAGGEAGFSGNDGRTTIFDYYNVPAFQQWYNEGRCNTQKLSPEQIELRKAYAGIIELCKQPVICKGEFYDLMWNNASKPGAFQKCVFAYLRWTSEEIWLIAANFCQNESIQTSIKIPGHFMELAKIKPGSVLKISEINSLSGKTENLTAEKLSEAGIIVSIAPLSYIIYQLRK